MIGAHGYGASLNLRWQAIYTFGPEANLRGWLLAAPRCTAKTPPLGVGAPRRSRAQRDLIDTINYVKQHYAVDESRIYLMGFSMGGQTAMIGAAKYPDVFAAAVEYTGFSSLNDWYTESEAWRQTDIANECGGTPAAQPFEYARRSPQRYALGFKQMPLAIVHGTLDTKVLPHHAQQMYGAVNAVGPPTWNCTGSWGTRQRPGAVEHPLGVRLRAAVQPAGQPGAHHLRHRREPQRQLAADYAVRRAALDIGRCHIERVGRPHQRRHHRYGRVRHPLRRRPARAAGQRSVRAGARQPGHRGAPRRNSDGQRRHGRLLFHRRRLAYPAYTRRQHTHPDAHPVANAHGDPTPTATPTLGQVVGTAYIDLNRDQVRQSGEPGVSGVTITLRQGATVIGASTTDHEGHYQFTNLAAGSYSVSATAPPEFGALSPLSQGIVVNVGEACRSIMPCTRCSTSSYR
ncbi:MAG: prolyl oligopeptidase family serine peptidase [Anaerolineae bacterium]|nr:MAG: prolyl oligopeptidase family serine peptidase [Anaerolineae bacterium]